MNRRHFLYQIIGGLGLGALPEKSPVASPLPPRRAVLIQESPLAGFQYHAGERHWPLLRVGQSLNLAREPNNPYDPQAVRVDWHGSKLGYLPRVENLAASQMLDRGERLVARIAGLRASSDPWERVLLAVWLA